MIMYAYTSVRQLPSSSPCQPSHISGTIVSGDLCRGLSAKLLPVGSMEVAKKDLERVKLDPLWLMMNISTVVCFLNNRTSCNSRYLLT